MSDSVESGLEPQALNVYAQPRLGLSLLDVATSVVPYLALTALMFVMVGAFGRLTVLFAIPAAGFLVRTYVVFHDCTYGSLFPSKRANRPAGMFLGLLVLAPSARWRHDHAVHHGSSGDLDRRGAGDIVTLTISEY